MLTRIHEAYAKDTDEAPALITRWLDAAVQIMREVTAEVRSRKSRLRSG